MHVLQIKCQSWRKMEGKGNAQSVGSYSDARKITSIGQGVRFINLPAVPRDIRADAGDKLTSLSESQTKACHRISKTERKVNSYAMICPKHMVPCFVFTVYKGVIPKITSLQPLHSQCVDMSFGEFKTPPPKEPVEHIDIHLQPWRSSLGVPA